MIIVDTSALIAILMNEPGATALTDLISARPGSILPAPAYVEATMVYGARKGEAGLRELDTLLDDLGLRIADFTTAHARAAREGFMRFGKGRHRAGLNFGDCLSYGVARVEGLPLLFTGTDFALTDVTPAGAD